MDETYTFLPPRRAGVIFHLGAIAALTLGGAWGLWQAMHTDIGLAFLLYLLPFIVALPTVPFLLYRLNALENSAYILARDSITLRWGLRLEVIPMNAVQWIRPAADLTGALRLPRVHWPGSVLGTRNFPGGSTVIEFMGSQPSALLVIAAPGRFFAISPHNPDEFLRAYQYFTELGSLLTPASQSVRPTIVMTRVWRTPPARGLTLLGILLSLVLLVWASLRIPGLQQVSLGFSSDGMPRTPIPGIRLMLFPILNGFIYLFNLWVGLNLFRRAETRTLAYLLWGASVFVAVLFLVAMYFALP